MELIPALQTAKTASRTPFSWGRTSQFSPAWELITDLELAVMSGGGLKCQTSYFAVLTSDNKPLCAAPLLVTTLRQSRYMTHWAQTHLLQKWSEQQKRLWPDQ